MASTAKHPGGNVVYSSNVSYWQPATNLLTMTSAKYCNPESSSKVAVVILNKYSVSGLDATKKITGFRLTTLCQRNSSETYSFRLVTGLSQGKSSYTNISTAARSIADDGNYNQHERIIEVTDASSAEVVWMNNNIDKVIAGTDFGIRLYFKAIVWYAALEIFYTTPGGLYVGTSGASAVYRGTTKANVYLGTKKIM